MKKESKIKLDNVELFYKFALGISILINKPGGKMLQTYGSFAYYNHIVKKEELELSKSEEKDGAMILEHVATFTMVVQLDRVLEEEWGEGRFESADGEIKKISRVVRLIRNAFAHDPMKPTWLITEPTKDKEYEIPEILTLKTQGLHGKRLERKDYGGPLALLRLLQYARRKLQ